MPSSRFRSPRSPSIFPVLFADRTEAAALWLGHPELLRVCKSHAEAKAFLNVFRDWRYCLRNYPYPSRCADIEKSMVIRTHIEPADGLFLVFLTVRHDPISILVSCNPELLPITIDADNPI